MPPGSTTAILYFFIAEYSEDMNVSESGNLAHKRENIEVLELDFNLAFNMTGTGEIKDPKPLYCCNIPS